MGLCILYDWPSHGTVEGYLPDRAAARQCAGDLTNILCELFDWLIKKQKDAATAAAAAAAGKKARVTPCKAKVSVIAHSMGNYVLQKAMAAAWTRKNQPLLVSHSDKDDAVGKAFPLAQSLNLFARLNPNKTSSTGLGATGPSA